MVFKLQENVTSYVEEAQIGNLNLFVGESFLYIFDFGDYWRFNIIVEGIEDKGIELADPIVVAGKGDSPRQY